MFTRLLKDCIRTFHWTKLFLFWIDCNQGWSRCESAHQFFNRIFSRFAPMKRDVLCYHGERVCQAPAVGCDSTIIVCYSDKWLKILLVPGDQLSSYTLNFLQTNLYSAALEPVSTYWAVKSHFDNFSCNFPCRNFCNTISMCFMSFTNVVLKMRI